MKTLITSFLLILISFNTKEATKINTFKNFEIGIKNDSSLVKPIEISIPKDHLIERRVIKILSDSGYSITMQKLILAQAQFESGNFKNPLSKNHNNIFSMRHPKKRPTWSLGPLAKAEGRKGYASFHSVDSATTDYILYCNYFKVPKKSTTSKYIHFLKKKGYFEISEQDYLKRINKWINNNKKLNLWNSKKETHI